MSSIQTYNNRGITYVRIVESYRDPYNKKPKVRVLKNLGRADVLEAQNPGIIDKMKRELKESKVLDEKLKQEATFNEIERLLQTPKKTIEQGFPLKNYGVKIYSDIWKEFKLDYFFDYRQKSLR